MDVEKVAILSLQPGDALLVSTDDCGDADAQAIAATLKSFCREHFGIDDVPVVFTNRVQLQIMRRGS